MPMNPPECVWVSRPLHKATKAFLVSLIWLGKKTLIMRMQNILPSSCCDWRMIPGSHPILWSLAIPLTHLPAGAHGKSHKQCLIPGTLPFLILSLLALKAEFSRYCPGPLF